MELRSFYFHHPQLFVVPVEHLTRRGVDPEFATVLAEERSVPDGFVELLNETVVRYFERLEHLFKKGRGTWFPPRLQNLCVVTDPAQTRPYYQPFAASSLLLYQSDFDPAQSNVEFAVYQLVHAERMGITRSLPSAIVQNLSYFVVRTESERAAFAEAARRSTRPDAAGFAALGEAMEWIGDLFHDKLRPPLALSEEPLEKVPGAGLLITPTQEQKLGELIHQFETAATQVVNAYYEHQAASLGDASAVERISAYLQAQQPNVLFADRKGRIIWEPDRADRVDGIEVSIDTMTDRAAQDICEDLAHVARRSDEVFKRLRDPEALPSHGEEVEQENGAYLHESRKMMVYSLEQPGLDTRREGAPPFHRWLLGARTAHEWGHLAADAELVAVPVELQAKHDQALDQLVELLDAVIERAPEAFRKQVDASFKSRPSGQSIGRAMVDLQMERIGDYKSNVLAREVLPLEEMESYVRANVRSLAQEPHSFLGKLARYAYEYQYLHLSRMKDPRHYFYSTTWFPENYIATGVITKEETDKMLDLMREAFDCYRLSPDALARE